MAPMVLARRLPRAFTLATSPTTACFRLTRTRSLSLSASERLNVAVVGTGRMGQIRLTGMQSDPRVRIAAVIDPAATPQRRQELSSQYSTQCFSSVAEARQELQQRGKTVDGVWIATPTPAHLELVTECAQGGLGSDLRAIGIEKPVAETLEEIDAAYAACLASGVQLFCSFQRRFDPSYAALRAQCVDKEALGQLQSIHTVFRDHPCPPIEFLKTGGDPFHDLAVHDIDYVCDLVGEYPTTVYAHGTSLSPELRAANVMDKASVWLEFPRSGVVCTMDLSRSAEYGYDQRIEVAGERGMLQVDNPRRTAVMQSTIAGISGDVLLHSFPERFREAYLLELDHFIDVLRGEAKPRVHWGAARMNTVVAEAARIAAVEKKVVTITYTKTRQIAPNADPLLDCEYIY